MQQLGPFGIWFASTSKGEMVAACTNGALAATRYVGEVGLDAGPRFYKSLDTQKHVFRNVFERCAEAGGKILTVHSVRSVPAVIEMMDNISRRIAALSCFTGSPEARARLDVARFARL